MNLYTTKMTDSPKSLPDLHIKYNKTKLYGYLVLTSLLLALGIWMLGLDPDSWRVTPRTGDLLTRKITWYILSVAVVVIFSLLNLIILYRILRNDSALILKSDYFILNNDFIDHQPVYWSDVEEIREIKYTMYLRRRVLPMIFRAIRITFKGQTVLRDNSIITNNIIASDDDYFVDTKLVAKDRRFLLKEMRRYWLTAQGKDHLKEFTPDRLEIISSKKETSKKMRRSIKRVIFGKKR